MAKKDVDIIVNDVLTCIDEIAENDSEWLKEQDAEEMNSVIKSKIYDAVRFVFLNADIGLLELSWKTGTESASNNVVTVALDNDVLRVCYAKLDGWVRPLSEPIVYTDKEYASLLNPITTGYPDNPKMAINFTDAGKQLEMYGASGSVKYKLGYMPDPKEENGEYDIPYKVYRGVVYYTAGLTLLTYKDAHADSLLNQAIVIIGAKTN